MSSTFRRVARPAVPAAAGAAWLAFLVAVWLREHGDLSYDGYFRAYAVPLALTALAVALLARTFRRWTLWAAGVGVSLAFAGDSLEFWGVLLQDKPNARVGWETGREAWWGSDVGWLIFGLGTLIAFVGGAASAVTAVRGRAAPWVVAVLGGLGPAVLAGNLLESGPVAVAAIAFGLVGVAWIATGISVRSRDSRRPRNRIWSRP